MNLKYEDLHYSDLGASLRNFNDVIKTRKQGDMTLKTHFGEHNLQISAPNSHYAWDYNNF